MISAGLRRGRAVALALLVGGSAHAVTLTVVNQTIIDGGITATNSANPSPTWVAGGAGSGIDYGTTQTSAIFTSAEGPAGTGNFNSFLGLNEIKTVQQDPGGNDTLEQGHNHSSNDGKPQPEVETGAHTDDVQLAEFGFVEIPNGGTGTLLDPEIVGGTYLSMAYDINPIKSVTQPRITWLQFQVYLSPTAITTQNSVPPSDPSFNLGTKIWDLDANSTDNSITVHENNAGSGSFDMMIYINVDDFLDSQPNANADFFLYVYLEADTYDEFNHNDLGLLSGAPDAYYPPPGGPIPEPGNLSLIGISLLLLALRRRRAGD